MLNTITWFVNGSKTLKVPNWSSIQVSIPVPLHTNQNFTSWMHNWQGKKLLHNPRTYNDVGKIIIDAALVGEF